MICEPPSSDETSSVPSGKGKPTSCAIVVLTAAISVPIHKMSTIKTVLMMSPRNTFPFVAPTDHIRQKHKPARSVKGSTRLPGKTAAKINVMGIIKMHTDMTEGCPTTTAVSKPMKTSLPGNRLF